MPNPDTPKPKAKNPPIKHDSDGVWLYRPTGSYPQYRLVWLDPATAKRSNRRYRDHDAAVAAFDETVTWLRDALRHQPATVDPKTRPNGPIVDDLFALADRNWELNGATLRYRQRCAGLYRKWIGPVCGQVPVRRWMTDRTWCLQVMHNGRSAGLAPASLQNIGALLRHLVTTAHDQRWALQADNPMRKVSYVARNARRDGPVYVEPALRPTTTMVEELIAALDDIGAELGLPELGLLAVTGGFGGLRFGEQTALRPVHWFRCDATLRVQDAWCTPSGVAPFVKTPKNGRPREVLMPASAARRVSARADTVTALEIPGGLLVPGRGGPDRPWTESAFRKVFIAAARSAGWPMAHENRPAIPYKNLRHHAATWMHDVAGMDWADVSAALGHHSVAFTHARYVLPAAGARARNRRRLDQL